MKEKYLLHITKSNLHIFKDYLNKIIEEAIIHGGDYGGAYFINKEELISEIKRFLIWTGLNKYLIVYEDDYPILLEKDKINKEEMK